MMQREGLDHALAVENGMLRDRIGGDQEEIDRMIEGHDAATANYILWTMAKGD